MDRDDKASTVLAGLATAFDRCYDLARQQSPDTRATFAMTANIGPAGEILEVRTLVPARYHDPMVVCSTSATITW